MNAKCYKSTDKYTEKSPNSHYHFLIIALSIEADFQKTAQYTIKIHIVCAQFCL